MPKRRKKPRPVDRAALESLRAQLGTRELARRMGIPAPSLRRLLGKGKSAGLPKRETKAYHKLVQQVGIARASEKTRRENKAWDRVRNAVWRGTLDQEFSQIAAELGLNEREVYTLGVSPD